MPNPRAWVNNHVPRWVFTVEEFSLEYERCQQWIIQIDIPSQIYCIKPDGRIHLFTKGCNIQIVNYFSARCSWVRQWDIITNKITVDQAFQVSSGLLESFFLLTNDTVKFKIFLRVLFSHNFAYAKFRENRILVKWLNLSIAYWYR